MQAKSLLLALLLALGAVGAKCDGLDEENAFRRADSACQAGMAQILIMDGLSKRLCGCLLEQNDTLVPAGSPLICTVAAGSKIYFHYSGRTVRHQIVSVGSPGFPSSPVFNPIDDAPIYTHVAGVDAAASSYNYQDQYNSRIFGRIDTQ